MYALEDHYWWFVARRGLALGLLARHVEHENPRILDLGCGTGVVLSELNKVGCAVGFDFSAEALRFCRERGLTNLVRGDGEHLPFIQETFDAIVGLDIFEHIEDDVQAFREVYRTLKPGGTLILSVPAFKSLWGPHDVALMHFRRYTRSELRSKLESCGFEIEKASYSICLLFPLVAVIRFFEKRKTGPAAASLPRIPVWLNKALIGLQSIERGIMSIVDLPFGSSVVVVATKASEAEV